MAEIILSYRRSDSQAMAGRIHDCLVEHYGDDAVFMDIESIPPGADFRQRIYSAIGGADLFLAVVGPRWRGRGGARIKDEADFVRIEVEAAMARKIPVIPVLVDDALMPKPAELPDSIKDFAFHNALKVDAGEDFHLHMTRLISAMDKILGPSAPPATFAAPVMALTPPAPGSARQRVLLGSAGGLAAFVSVGAVATWWLWTEEAPGGWIPPSPRSHWSIGGSEIYQGSITYLEPSGMVRQFFLVTPGDELHKHGAQAGDLLFDGRKEGSTYVGKAFVFAGRCGKVPFDVHGPVLNDDQTVDLAGNAPEVDTATCNQRGTHEQRLVFDFKYRK